MSALNRRAFLASFAALAVWPGTKPIAPSRPLLLASPLDGVVAQTVVGARTGISIRFIQQWDMAPMQVSRLERMAGWGQIP